MEKDSELREELLKQMDRDAGGGPNAAQKAAQTILTKDAARLRRMKCLTVSSWLFLAAAFLASGVTGALSGFRSELWGISSIIGLQALLIIAVSFTVVLSVRARTLKMRQIQAALADIQDQLKAMSRNKAEKA
jgi:hypothetical protein